jgi:hypothetical protein
MDLPEILNLIRRGGIESGTVLNSDDGIWQILVITNNKIEICWGEKSQGGEKSQIWERITPHQSS